MGVVIPPLHKSTFAVEYELIALGICTELLTNGAAYWALRP